jgi:hypothetical protein
MLQRMITDASTDLMTPMSDTTTIGQAPALRALQLPKVNTSNECNNDDYNNESYHLSIHHIHHCLRVLYLTTTAYKSLTVIATPE